MAEIHAGRFRSRVILTAMGKLGELLPELSPDQADQLAAELTDAARRARLHAQENAVVRQLSPT